MSNFVSDDDHERIMLLDTVSKHGLKILTKEELLRLQTLVEKKHYGNNKKMIKSKTKLLERIAHEIYNKEKGGFCI